MNAVILTSVLSAGNHALFAGARVLYGLSVIRQAPAIFRKTNRNGVPWVSVLAIASVSLIFFGASFLPGGASE
jgi:AAT family amino acid transporter